MGEEIERKIVGHKTFSDGPLNFRHEPLYEDEARAIIEASDAAQRRRAETMPDEQSAINAMHAAHDRLGELGWRDAIYCPKDGSSFFVIEPGSTGIHRAHYQGEWPTGSWWIEEDGDLSPSHPCMFKLYPEQQAEYDAKMEAARERYHAAAATKGGA